MRKTIVRTLIRSTAPVYQTIIENEIPVTKELEPVSAWGKVTQNDLKRVAQNKYGKDGNYIIGNITMTEECYRIGIDEFVTAAVRIGSEDENQEDEE